MPILNFKGKSIVQNHHLMVKYHELLPDKEKSYTHKVSLHDNLIIHGDNLIALKALLPTYAGKVDCIYIDPPYNTGHEKWVYNDNVNSPMLQEWLGRVVDQDDLSRHDKWLCMMLPRLKLLKELLHDDGVIFISIDHHELHHLICLMNEIFGEANYRDAIIIRRGVKSVQAQFETIDSLSSGYETVLVYTKNPQRRFNKVYEEVEAKPGRWNNHWRGTERPSMRYELFKIIPQEGQWRWGKERSEKAIENYRRMLEELRKRGIDTPTQEDIDQYYTEYLEKNGRKLDLLRLSEKGWPEHYVPPTDKKLLSNAWFDLKPTGSSQLKSIFGKKVFDNPKSTELVKRLIAFATDHPEAVILDSFAGSGTTAQAVLELNQADGGNRKFILVEMEDYADAITAERVRRVISIQRLQETFSFFRLGDPIDIESILSGEKLPSYDDLARYLFYTATGEEFDPDQIDHDRRFIGESSQYEVYLLYQPDLDYLKTTSLDWDFVDQLGPYRGKKRLVFAPMKFVDNEDLQQYGIEFVQLPFEIYSTWKGWGQWQ